MQLVELLREAQRRTVEGQASALVTVVATKGSTPRRAGARMLVDADGSIVSTIGGGCVEAEARRAALDVIRTGQPRLLAVDLTADVAADEGAVCGGLMEVLIEPLKGDLPR